MSVQKQTQTSHTPGPWRVARHGFGTDGYLIFSDYERKPNGTAEHYIATDVRQEANAHLIAAAPELLEAAQIVLNGGIEAGLDWQAALDRLKAAIAHATSYQETRP